ncbi:GGDEF domain-containing protein, partial [Duganella sp. CY42W]|nr:GGDEF domain-containing protein [Duganella levis]
MVDMFALDDELAQWETALPDVQGTERLKLLMALAWHIRQRDPARAQQLSTEIVPLLALLAPDAALVQRARLHLITAEPAWLRGDLDTAFHYAEQALLLCDQAADSLPAAAAACRADACWIMAWASNDRGLSADGDDWLRQAAAAARV